MLVAGHAGTCSQPLRIAALSRLGTRRARRGSKEWIRCLAIGMPRPANVIPRHLVWGVIDGYFQVWEVGVDAPIFRLAARTP